jgi:hypothetical protein
MADLAASAPAISWQQPALPCAPILVPITHMKHAGAAALDRLEPLLKDIRKRDSLKEKSRGCFYRAGRGFLHFHEHGTDIIYADIRVRGDDFERLDVSSGAQRKSLLRLIDSALADGKASLKR